MTTPVEERLRRALAQQARTTTTAPDGWRRVRARLDRGGHVRRPGFGRWLLLAPAAGVAVVALVIVATLVGQEGGRTVRVAGGAGRLYLVPTGVEPRFHLLTAVDDPQVAALPPGTFRAFGRRAGDGLTLDASAVITVPADFALSGANPTTKPLRVLGREVAVVDDGFGSQIPTWAQADGRTVAVMTYGLTEAQLVALVGSLLPGDATTDMPSLPAGFTPVRSGALPEGTPAVSIQEWQADDGARFGVSVSDAGGVTVDDLAWWLPGGRATKVRNKTAISADRSGQVLTWIERPGVAVTVYSRDLSEKELGSVAEGLRPVVEAEWRALKPAPGPIETVGPGPVVGSPPGVTPSPTAFFLIVPVKGQVTTPCASGSGEILLPEMRDGKEVGCYRVTRPLVDAGHVTGVSIRQNRAGSWDVEFVLSADGGARLDVMLRDVGLGGQLAIVVDGVIVSVVGVEVTSTTGRGVVTGLDEQTARRLADRLAR